MTPFNLGEQFGDTTYTKVFVGGLAWETKTDTMRKYFEQFGEIWEAVVITEKNTGRSKGYGFVTFREPEAATRACVDGTPMIDGRRANCNLAAMGVKKSRPTTSKHGGGWNFRLVKSFQTSGHRQGGMGSALTSPITFPHYVIQQGIPYSYGYSPYYGPYAMGYYNYGTASSSSAATGAQYPIYGGASGIVTGNTSTFYPYYHIGNGSSTGVAASYAQGNGYTMQYPHILQYSMMNSQSYVGQISLAPNTKSAGVTVALTSPTQASHRLAPHALRLTPAHFIQQHLMSNPWPNHGLSNNPHQVLEKDSPVFKHQYKNS